MTTRELFAITTPAFNETAGRSMKAQWDQMAKPLDSMGLFEDLAVRIAKIGGKEALFYHKRALVVMCADNGIVAEGISQSGQERTLEVSRMLAEGSSSVCTLAKHAGVTVLPVDIGINSGDKIPGLLDRKVCRGTKNFLKEPALSEEEAVLAIERGIEIAKSLAEQGYDMLALGEMGIGNTTTSAAVACALLGEAPEKLVGRGAGLSDAGLKRKREVITMALARYDFSQNAQKSRQESRQESRQKSGQERALSILCAVGGLDIAGLVGVCIGGALARVPVVLDGVISGAAALLAEWICPGVKDFLIASHEGKEPAAGMLLEALGLRAIIHGELALGEGSGAVLLFSLMDAAFSLYEHGASFRDVQLEGYQRL